MDIDFMIWIFFIIFVLHNFEEIIFIERWFKYTYPQVKERVPTFAKGEMDQFGSITSEQFSIVVCLLTIVAAVMVVISVTTEYFFVFFGLNLFFALNIFTHSIQSIFLRIYVPGVVTSILLILPYNAILFYLLYTDGMLNAKLFLYSLFIGIILIPAFMISHKLGEKWAS